MKLLTKILLLTIITTGCNSVTNKTDSNNKTNNLKQKATVLSKEEFDSLQQRILGLLQAGPADSRQLLYQLTGVKKEKAWKVLNFLQAENKIGMEVAGILRLK